MKNVYVVEDSPRHQELVRSVLSALPEVNATCFPDGLEGYRAVTRRQPDLLMLDIILPGLGGVAICKLLKRHEDYRALPILMMSSIVDANIKDRVSKAGADTFLPKPYEPDQLLEAVERLLAK